MDHMALSGLVIGMAALAVYGARRINAESRLIRSCIIDVRDLIEKMRELRKS